jgi:hypothetical protein
MSELSIEPEMPEEKLKEVPIERKPEKNRIQWVDMARGFIILYLIATISFPGDSDLPISGIPIIRGIFENAAIGSGRMTLYDIGAPALIFILGFTMPISYRKRKEEKGASAAVKYILFRYLILFVLGFVIANFQLDFLKYYSEPLDGIFLYTGEIPLVHRPILFIINWGVVSSIAMSGLIGFLFMAVRNPKYRFFLAYGWLIVYQFMLGTTVLDVYATESVHGGIFGSIFGYGAIAIMATAMGDFIFFSDAVETRKFQTLLIFGIINFALPLIFYLRIDRVELQLLIDGFAVSKYLVNMMFVLTSVGLTCIGLWGFYQIDTRFKKSATWLRIFGLSPFLFYFIAQVPDFIFEIIVKDIVGWNPIPWWLSLGWGILILAYCSFTAWYLYKNNKRISTVKTSLIFLATIIGLLLLFIVLELTGAIDMFAII